MTDTEKGALQELETWLIEEIDRSEGEAFEDDTDYYAGQVEAFTRVLQQIKGEKPGV